jgi:hypothetical protein
MQPGEIYSVWVPYADGRGGKYRPALKSSGEKKVLVICIVDYLSDKLILMY